MHRSFSESTNTTKLPSPLATGRLPKARSKTDSWLPNCESPRASSRRIRNAAPTLGLKLTAIAESGPSTSGNGVGPGDWGASKISTASKASRAALTCGASAPNISSAARITARRASMNCEFWVRCTVKALKNTRSASAIPTALGSPAVYRKNAWLGMLLLTCTPPLSSLVRTN